MCRQRPHVGMFCVSGYARCVWFSALGLRRFAARPKPPCGDGQILKISNFMRFLIYTRRRVTIYSVKPQPTDASIRDHHSTRTDWTTTSASSSHLVCDMSACGLSACDATSNYTELTYRLHTYAFISHLITQIYMMIWCGHKWSEVTHKYIILFYLQHTGWIITATLPSHIWL